MSKIHIFDGGVPVCGTNSMIALSIGDACKACTKVLEVRELRIFEERSRLQALLARNRKYMSVPVQIDGVIELLTWAIDGAKGKPPTKRWFR